MVEAKQVKVDNWGIFFLQRLQQFYNKTFFTDLTLQFEDNIQLKVHRLVMNACTEYFQNLESTCMSENDVLLMPGNLTSDVVVPIINFMYSGILEFHESLFDKLYSTAKLMNMSVLTKLLDAQKNPIQPVKPKKQVQSVTPITWNLQGKKIQPKPPPVETDFPEPLPGRKLPIWKRKSAPITHPYIPTGLGYEVLKGKHYQPTKVSVDETPRPTRFEWPDDDADTSFDSSFDEISYESKPIILPSISKESTSKAGNSSTFDDIKRSGSSKRPASPVGNQCKKVNIQDVKEYLREHKIRSDYIEYDDSEATDNDLQTYEHVDDHDSNDEEAKDVQEVFINQNMEETPSKGILKTERSESSVSPGKHVRFSLDGKENSKSSMIKIQTSNTSPNTDVTNHTKIITEVLKKYPHLVKKNKNIKLKILAKPSPSPVPGKVLTSTNIGQKQGGKVQYMVVKNENEGQANAKVKLTEQDQGSWICKKCDQPIEFSTYYDYRQHLTEIHNEKVDSQMCNICGHISRKQNMLVYHKYTRHNIQPPAMYNFPKCNECSYIALSPLILSRHQMHHKINREKKAQGLETKLIPPWSCRFCDKAFFSENILMTHQRRSHDLELKQMEDEQLHSPPKEKIKIISDIKMDPSLPPGTTLIPVRQLEKQEMPSSSTSIPDSLEPSSEAEALSNVASGIAASLGLVDTIVVLDENQFILQSTQGNLQQNVLQDTSQDYIIPDMMPDLTSIATTTINTGQNPVVTLSSDTNTVLTQSGLNKSEIGSTDELVMVLTDHDYSDAANQTVISADNNIVVLYSHPVQTRAAMMINSETGMLEVDQKYSDSAAINNEHTTEESIEMIQQEINNHMEAEVQAQDVENVEYVQRIDGRSYQVCTENVVRMLEENPQGIIVDEVHTMEEMVPKETVNQMDEESEIATETVSETEFVQETEQDSLSEIPQETISDIQQETMSESPQETISEIQQESMSEISQETISENPQETISEISQETISEIPQETISEISQETISEIPQETISEISQESISEVPQGTMSEISQETMSENSQETPSEISQETISENPQETMLDIPTETVSEISSETVPEYTTETVPENTTESAIETESEAMEISENEVSEETYQPMETEHEEYINNETLTENIPPEQTENETIETPLENETTSEEITENTMEEQIEDDETNIENIEMTETTEEPQQIDEEMENVGVEEEELIEESGNNQITEANEEVFIENESETTESDIQMETEQITTSDEPEPVELNGNQPENQTEDVEKTDNNIITENSKILENTDELLESTQKLLAEQEMEQEETIENINKELMETQKQSTEESLNIETNTEDYIVEDRSNIQEKSQVSGKTNKRSDDEDEEENIVEAIKSEVKKEIIQRAEKKKLTAISSVQAKEKISKILDDWDDADADSPQSGPKTPQQGQPLPSNGSSINKLIDDWEDEEEAT